MAITNVRVYDHSAPNIFRESKIAHKYLDGLNGVEIGAAAHNPFGLEGCINVGLKYSDPHDFEFFKSAQAQMCGFYANIDVEAEATFLPFDDEEMDYVITSHVIEHIENPIRAFRSWNAVVKRGGYIVMIFPKRDSLVADIGRPVSTIEEFVRAAEEDWSVSTVPKEYLKLVPGGNRGHYWVFTLQSMLNLIEYCNGRGWTNWKILESLETDDKVGNGHMIVAVKQ